MDKEKILINLSAVISVFAPVFVWAYLGLDAHIPADFAETIFSTLVQVNATLIGFFGIVMVYKLKSYSDTMSMLQTRALSTLEKKQLLENDIVYEVNQKISDKLKRQKEIYQLNLDGLADWIKAINVKRSHFGNFSILFIVFFVVSIIFSIVAIAKIADNVLATVWLVPSLVPMFLGVYSIAMSLGSSVPTEEEVTQKENTGNETKKQ